MVKKAVVLAAGLGRRFSPITKVIPKPMLPIGNKPALDYVVDELAESGIEQILLVVGHKREIIEEYYCGRKEIHFIVQNQLNGTAPAILLAEPFVNKEPFAVCYSDEIMESSVPCIKQLIDVFMANNASMVTALEQTTPEKIKSYNSVQINEVEKNLFELLSIVEKPQDSRPPLYTAVGRFIFSPLLFDYIKLLKEQEGREVYATDAFNLLMKEHKAYGLNFNGKRWDIGTKEGWVQTNVRFGLT